MLMVINGYDEDGWFSYLPPQKEIGSREKREWGFWKRKIDQPLYTLMQTEYKYKNIYRFVYMDINSKCYWKLTIFIRL